MKVRGSHVHGKVRRQFTQIGAWLGVVIAVLAICAAPSEAGEWRVLSVNGAPAEGDAIFSFNPDGTLSGSTGCNRFTAAPLLTAGWMVVEGPVATTQMACPGALASQEAQILSVFEDGLSLTYDPFVEILRLTGRSVTVILASIARASDPATTTPGQDEGAATAAPPESPAASAPPSSGPETTGSPAGGEATLLNTAYVAVQGLSGRLNVRAEPSASAKIVGGAREGALLANKGCETRPDRTWCHVAHIGNGRPEGWVAAEYLKPAPAPLRASEALFDRIGTLTCTASTGGPTETCDYGVARDPDGTAAILVFLPDGNERLVTFREGQLVPSGTSSDSEAVDVSATPVGGQVLIAFGESRFELPASVLSGE